MSGGTSFYEQIVALKEFPNSAERGYRFESILREILPWSTRPPVVIVAPSEQIDAFFEWNNSIFLVEAKAKKEKLITAGSHDWEDFELKLRKRKGACIGLYCSLYPVHENVIRAAENLNREGICTIILHGNVWDELSQEQLPLDKLIQFLILHARAKFSAVPPGIGEVREWIFDREVISSRIANICRNYSAIFLRRHKSPRHSDLYVRRHIDSRISEISNALTPSKLLVRSRVHRDNKGKERVIPRKPPYQICVIRDTSGSGKTTSAVQVALSSQNYFGASRSALESDVDDIGGFLQRVGEEYGIQELITADRPIIMAIDSLDEANVVANKRQEVLSLVRFLDVLNKAASKRGLLAFPLCLVFTVREEYWRMWDSVFEGRWVATVQKRLSRFTDFEFEEAFVRYSSAYGYVTASRVSRSTREVLSIPFNLQVFSEANEYLGFISVVDALVDNVMHLYFTRKGESILRQRIPGFNPESLMKLCSSLAMKVVAKGRNSLSRPEILKVISDRFPQLSSLADQVILSIVSEQILSRDMEESTEYRFRHTRFIEYLVAYHIVSSVDYEGTTAHLDSLISMIVESDTISMYSVHECVRYICQSQFRHIRDLIDDHYSRSHQYMEELLSHLRADVGSGLSTPEEDIKLIQRNAEASNPGVAWDSFFVLAAKRNRQPKDKLISAFKLAWKSNRDRPDRWKLVQKLWSHDLLLNELVLFSVLEGNSWKEWQVYLGCIIESPQRECFPEFWAEVSGVKLTEAFKGNEEEEEWERVMKLIDILVERKPYVPGC